jgi:hypothetical protein
MTGNDLRDARKTLGEMWGLRRPLTMNEMGAVLRLTGKDPGATIRDYERGKNPISGPISLAVEMLLQGGPLPEGVDFGRGR